MLTLVRDVTHADNTARERWDIPMRMVKEIITLTEEVFSNAE